MLNPRLRKVSSLLMLSIKSALPLNQTFWSLQVHGAGWRRNFFVSCCSNPDLGAVHVWGFTHRRRCGLGKTTCAQIQPVLSIRGAGCETLCGNRPSAHVLGSPGGGCDVMRWDEDQSVVWYQKSWKEDSSRFPSLSKIKTAWEQDLRIAISEGTRSQMLKRAHSSSTCAWHSLIRLKVVHRLHLSKYKLTKI